MGTVGWRDIAQACSRLGTAEANLLRLPVAARVVYSEPQVVQELLSAADGGRGNADPHAALHVRFVDAPLPSVSGVMVVASCVRDGLPSPLPVTTLLSSGKEYTFDFDRAQLLRR